jgi:hypothetical protein
MEDESPPVDEALEDADDERRLETTLDDLDMGEADAFDVLSEAMVVGNIKDELLLAEIAAAVTFVAADPFEADILKLTPLNGCKG